MNLKQQTLDEEKQSLVRQVRAAQQGEREAFESLFQKYHRAVYAVGLRRLGNHAEVQELCQEVFIQAMRKIGQLENPACFGGWLRAIAHRMAINRAVRRGPVATAATQTVEAECVERRTPLGAVLAQEQCDEVQRGLNRLTALDRDTLVAFYFQGQSLVQMSNAFRSPVGTIKRRLHVARKRLAKQLEALAPA